MENTTKSILSNSLSGNYIDDKNTFKPIVFNMANDVDRHHLEVFLHKNNSQLNVHNSIENQILELYKINNPQRKIGLKEQEDFYQQWLSENDPDFYGTWVFYPWNRNLVHLLPEEDFIRLRTSRNQYKIHPTEQELLSSKTIGLIGLSVGQSVALTLSMERVYGSLRIADFDHLDLSNLNRIRSGVANLGLPKTSIVAREIAEIDPFLKVEVFAEGINEENLPSFIGEGENRIDLLIEECDALDIKIKARLAARAKGVPVLMDTSDRGMMDIERFDLEPNRPLMHGMVEESRAHNVDQWTAKERLALVMDMVGADNISSRLKASLLEVESSLTTWPQLASSVALGGALSTVAARQILLGQEVLSGRFYTDADALYLKQQESRSLAEDYESKKPLVLSFESCENLLSELGLADLASDAVIPSDSQLEDLVSHACLAPTGGNVQAWKWLFKEGYLALFHDQHFSHSFLDFNHRGSYIGLGAAMENLQQRAAVLGFEAVEHHRLTEFGSPLVAVYSFRKSSGKEEALRGYGNHLNIRLTNRLKPLERQLLPTSIKDEIKEALQGSAYKMSWVENETEISKLAQIIGKVERQRILDPHGHYDFINEARWTEEQAELSRNGVDLRTLELSEADKVGFKLIQDSVAIENLRNWDRGHGLIKMSTDSMHNISALALLYTNNHEASAVLEGGQWVERIWLHLNNKGVAYQPVSPATFMFARLSGHETDASPYLRDNLRALRKEYLSILDLDETVNDLFLCRLFFAPEPAVKSLRKPLQDVYKKL